MSIVIIGGHERMETQYKQICKKYKCFYQNEGKPERADWETGSDDSFYSNGVS